MNKIKPELLAPAGSFEKAKTAFLYGADAVYCGTGALSLRSRAEVDNDDLAKTIKYAHSIGKKVYAAINIYAWDSYYEEIKEQAKMLNDLKVDAIIASDGGVMEILKQYAPDVEIHVSTQANTVSYHSANFWYKNGAKRVILGRELNKEQIREIARQNNLKVANKPDSEDICFIPDGNYKKFLETNSNIKPKKGKIVNSKGEVLGEHTGLYNYTIGQRKGLGISYKVPLFVLGFNPQKNEVIVGEESELYKKELIVKDINLLLVDKIEKELDVDVKTRYSSKVAKATIIQQDEDTIKVTFKEPQRALTPGQSAVFYIDDIVLGGGKIV